MQLRDGEQPLHGDLEPMTPDLPPRHSPHHNHSLSPRGRKLLTWGLVVICVIVTIYIGWRLAGPQTAGVLVTSRSPTKLAAPGVPGVTPGSAPDIAGTPKEAVVTEIIEAHNAIRQKVGVPPLQWSDELAQVAQRYAENLMRRNAFEHSQDDRYGENLFRISGPGADANPFDVVTAWASESVYYHYRNNSCSEMCGHYTQIVWKDTKAVGCGAARDADKEIWVCNYAPYGNIIGERPF